MFTLDKVEIGRHIADLIDESRFKSARQFGIEYLRVRYGSVDEDAIPNIQNRISQIINKEMVDDVFSKKMDSDGRSPHLCESLRRFD